MTLTEFLLARYAEDADYLAGMACDCPPDDTAPGCATRLQADLDAKREVVDLLSKVDTADSDSAIWILAQPYRHHPDYRYRNT